jgi:hypothetical protein
MIPLERYLASLMPLARNISPYRAAPKVKPFSAEDFLRSLDACGPQVKLFYQAWHLLVRALGQCYDLKNKCLPKFFVILTQIKAF